MYFLFREKYVSRPASARQTYRKAITVQNSRIQDALIWFDSARRAALNYTKAPGFDQFERSYSSALRWPRGTLGVYPRNTIHQNTIYSFRKVSYTITSGGECSGNK